MKYTDFVRVQTRPTRKQTVLSAVDAVIGTLLFAAFAIVSMGVIGLLAH